MKLFFFWDALYLLFKDICLILLLFVDDEKNKMLPEAESINKDGSQDGLMEAANIPLQSKEEDQMWKILQADERYTKQIDIYLSFLSEFQTAFSL